MFFRRISLTTELCTRLLTRLFEQLGGFLFVSTGSHIPNQVLNPAFFKFVRVERWAIPDFLSVLAFSSSEG